MSELFLKPGFPGAVIRDPQDGSRLPEAGALKELTPYWRRLLLHGDVLKSAAPVAAGKNKPEMAKE